MKKITNLLYAAFVAVLSVGFVSCEETAPEYVAGQQDLEGCYGVYFPTQAAAGEHTLDPTAPKSIDVTIMRKVAEGEITVPVVVSNDSIFNVPEVVFADGQTETTITITFPDVETAVKYDLTLEVTDPAYASLFSSNPVSLSFSVFCVEWKWLGVDADGNQTSVATEEEAATVSFTEAWWGEAFDDVKIKYYEVNGLRNCVAYRGEAGMWADGIGTEFHFIMDVKANAEGKYDLDVKKQYLGFDYADWVAKPEASASAPIYFYDWYNYLITDGGYSASSWADASDFYAKNGAAYPRSYYDGMGGYYFNMRYHVPAAGGGWTPAQFDIVAIVNGVLRLDFTTRVSIGETVEGVAPVTFAMGKDVASVKYTVVEGEITDKVAAAYCDSIVNDSENRYAMVTPENAMVGLELAKSGVYTLVAVPFDAEGVAQQPEKDKAFLAVPFTYVAAGEAGDYAAVVTLGVEETSALHAKDGYTNVNSFGFYVYGNDIVDAKLAVFETANYAVNPDSCNALVAEFGASLSAEELALVNGTGLSDLVTELKPLTSYTIVLWAYNGYRSTVLAEEYTTSGVALELLGTGTYTYTCMFNEPVTDPGLSFYKDPNYENTYKITNWFYGVDFTFTWDGGSIVKVADQFSGYEHASYGNVNVVELSDYAGQEMSPSYYDAETKTFYFGVVYYVSAGNFGYGYETFTVDGSQPAAARARRTTSSSVFNTQWGMREAATFAPQIAGLAIERTTSKTVDFTVKSIEKVQRSKKISNQKIVVE